MTESCLVVFIVESFRIGGQCSRIIGNPESFDEQMAAISTHIKFLRHLNEAGYNVFTYVGTYETPYVENLLKEYNPDRIDIYSNTSRLGLQTLFHNSYKNINIDDFQYLVYIRIDLYLKDEFFRHFS